ncbi:MAG: prepilin-type N-terminal cleavage/methylation domain-containing protein [Chthoniobacteraceae bacterium]
MKPLPLPAREGFTLIEVMVASLIVVILAGILISATDLTARSFQRTSAKIEQFSEARRGFEVLTRRLAEATLNTYWDYYDKNGNPRPTTNTRRNESNYDVFKNFVPAAYGRQSELRFVSGPMNTGPKDEQIDPTGTADRPTHGVFFQAPIGEVDDRDTIGMLDQSLNCWGYFLEVDDDTKFIPKPLTDLVQPRRRSRLLEFRQPTEHNPIYWPPFAGAASAQKAEIRNWWFIGGAAVSGIDTEMDRPVRVVSENIIALLIIPRLSRNDELARQNDPNLKFNGADDDRIVLSPTYFFDSALNTTRLLPNKPLTASERPEDVNPKNQLPPTVQVVIVALDETSARNLDEDPTTKGKPGFDLKLEEIFKRSLRLEDDRTTDKPSDGELSELEAKLIAKRLAYRIFNTTVIIRGAKWSRAQSS